MLITYRFLCVVLLLTASVTATAELGQAVQMHQDVAKLIELAKKRDTLWPWKGPEPEVERVVKYGEAVAPLLLTHLVEDPDTSDVKQEIDLNVQQQVALALCKIYKVREGEHVYSNRATRAKNASVKKFWTLKVKELEL